jgi:hypothetical protein
LPLLLWSIRGNDCRPHWRSLGLDTASSPYFLNFFCFVAGYVLLGKNFADLGFPSLYVGELTLAMGKSPP